MGWLIAGLVLLLGVHTVGVAAPDFRERRVASLGLGPWKGIYSLVSLAGLALIIWGFAIARRDPVTLWQPPAWMPHVTALFAVIGFVLVAAAYIPGSRIKAMLGHPMLAGIKTWAFGHLIGNGTLAGIVLFGALVLWSASMFATLRRRDRAAGRASPPGSGARDALVVVAGIVAALLFAKYLHGPLIGLAPFG
ncbi:MAG TPA: NnrU family protein [Casimicrobiaceae bacterium]|jgi:uncharacterized membrane protein